jgi:broad specificity phosphatase PhoE
LLFAPKQLAIRNAVFHSTLESRANIENIFAGPGYPAPLTAKGRRQAKIAGQDILDRRISIDHIIASPMERAKETATIIADRIGFDLEAIRYDHRLVEHDMGSLNGKTMEGITRGRQIIEAPGAERPIDFQKRVLAAMEDIKALSGNVLIVSHGGVGRILEATRNGSNLYDFYDLAGYPNAIVIDLQL